MPSISGGFGVYSTGFAHQMFWMLERTYAMNQDRKEEARGNGKTATRPFMKKKSLFYYHFFKWTLKDPLMAKSSRVSS